MNFVNYLKNMRIREAKRLLVETDLKITDISHKVGYENDKHFMKIFKNICGVSLRQITGKISFDPDEDPVYNSNRATDRSGYTAGT